MILKSDNGPAILKLLKDSLKTARVEITELEQIQDEQAVKYDSESIGDFDDAVEQVTKLPRALKICFGKGFGKTTPTSHPFLTWLVQPRTPGTMTGMASGRCGDHPFASV